MKNYQLILILALSIVLGCVSKSDKPLPFTSESEFTLSEFEKDSIEGTQWITKIFDSINEPNLEHLDYECYRFNYLDAFGKNKLFRLEHFNEQDNRLIMKLYDKDKNYDDEIYSITSEKTLDLTANQYKEFKKLINGSYFWSMNMFEYPSPQYLDGYAFLLEGFEPERANIKQRYHIVARQVPHNGSFKSACEKLIEFYNQEMNIQ